MKTIFKKINFWFILTMILNVNGEAKSTPPITNPTQDPRNQCVTDWLSTLSLNKFKQLKKTLLYSIALQNFIEHLGKQGFPSLEDKKEFNNQLYKIFITARAEKKTRTNKYKKRQEKLQSKEKDQNSDVNVPEYITPSFVQAFLGNPRFAREAAEQQAASYEEDAMKMLKGRKINWLLFRKQKQKKLKEAYQQIKGCLVGRTPTP